MITSPHDSTEALNKLEAQGLVGKSWRPFDVEW